MPRRADRHGGFPAWAWVAIGAVVVALIAIFVFTRGGDDAPTDKTPAPGSAAAMAQLCSDVGQLQQVIRTDALGRAQDELKVDATALKEAGDKATAKKVNQLIAAVGDPRTALEDQQDTTGATNAMAEAIDAVGCS